MHLLTNCSSHCPVALQWQISQDTVWDMVLRGTSLCVGAFLLYLMRWFVALPFVAALWLVRLAWSHLFWRPSWVGVAVNAVWHGCEFIRSSDIWLTELNIRMLP